MRGQFVRVDRDDWAIRLPGYVLGDAGITEVVEVHVSKGEIILRAVLGNDNPWTDALQAHPPVPDG
jgi:hypothetical protein